jgi:hypothetical protein
VHHDVIRIGDHVTDLLSESLEDSVCRIHRLFDTCSASANYPRRVVGDEVLAEVIGDELESSVVPDVQIDGQPEVPVPFRCIR